MMNGVTIAARIDAASGAGKGDVANGAAARADLVDRLADVKSGSDIATHLRKSESGCATSACCR